MKQGWEIKKLGDVATILDSQRKPVTKKNRCNGIYPYYGASGVQDYVDKYIFDGRYLLVGEDGAKWGASDKSAYIVDGKCWVNNHVHILKLDDSINDKMVEYYLVYKDLSKYITGAIVPKLTQQALKQIPIPVPGKAEQERIVGELDLLSGIIDKQRAQLKELDTLALSFFYSTFGEDSAKRHQWQTCKIGDVYKFQYGKGNKIPENKGIYPCYGSNGIVGYHTEYNSEDSPIIGHIGAYAGIVNWGKGKHFVTYNGVMCWLKSKNFNPIYGFYMLKGQNYLEKARTGVAQPFVSYDALESPIIYIPPIELQNEFAEKIENIEKQKEAVTRSIAETQKLFDYTMDKYFG